MDRVERDMIWVDVGLQEREERKPQLVNAKKKKMKNFCGREDIVTSVLEQVRSAKSDRVITLVGPPGFGKTSIAIAVGQHLIEEKEVGVAFVPLRGALDKQQVANRIVSTLSPRSSDNPTDLKPLRELVKALPANTLIVLDNAEDAINPELQGNRSNEPGFETVVNDILGSNKSVKVLVTSRVKFQPLDFRVSEHPVGGFAGTKCKTPFELPLHDQKRRSRSADSTTMRACTTGNLHCSGHHEVRRVIIQGAATDL